MNERQENALIGLKKYFKIPWDAIKKWKKYILNDLTFYSLIM
jgi:hypothetical protein